MHKRQRMLPVSGPDSTRPAMALTNKQKTAIAKRAYSDVAAGKPSPFKTQDSSSTSPQPPAPKK